ncbi:hypothetical protein GCM10027427_16240 [Pseudoclavibacter terrae]
MLGFGMTEQDQSAGHGASLGNSTANAEQADRARSERGGSDLVSNMLNDQILDERCLRSKRVYIFEIYIA